MNVEQMRTELMKIYGPHWAERVKKMKDNQIIALYKKMKLKGHFK